MFCSYQFDQFFIIDPRKRKAKEAKYFSQWWWPNQHTSIGKELNVLKTRISQYYDTEIWALLSACGKGERERETHTIVTREDLYKLKLVTKRDIFKDVWWETWSDISKHVHNNSQSMYHFVRIPLAPSYWWLKYVLHPLGV